MANYSVEIKRSALKEIEAIPQKTIRQRVVRRYPDTRRRTTSGRL